MVFLMRNPHISKEQNKREITGGREIDLSQKGKGLRNRGKKGGERKSMEKGIRIC